MTYQVITGTGSATVNGTSRFVRATPMNLAILRAGITTATLITTTILDDTPITTAMRAMFRAMAGMMTLVSTGAVGGDGLYTFNVQTPDGRTLRTSEGPIIVTLPTSAVSTLTLSIATVHDGWFLISGTHQRATLVATSTSWLPITGESDVISDTRRLCTIPLATAIELAALIESENFIAVLGSYVTGPLPHFSIGAEEVTGTTLVTLDAATYPHPATHTDPVLIELTDPMDPLDPVPVLTEFKIVFV